MLAPMSDDAKRSIRQFAASVVLALVPFFGAWAVEELKLALKRNRSGDDDGPRTE